MKENQFIQKNTSSWTILKDLTNALEKKGPSKLTAKELRKFLHLFRQASHHLAYARTHFPNSDVILYLNSLVGQAHNHIYAVKKNTFKEILSYITFGFPKQIQKFRSYILTSFFIFLLGFLVSFVLVKINTDYAYYFLPKEMVKNINWDMTGSKDWNYPLMSSLIMVNNITVSLNAFVFGITLGLGTIYVLFFNGTMLGSLTALVYAFGNTTNYWSLILPHGIIELTAIFISGGAGLIIARSFLIPNEYSRKHSLIKGAKEAVSLVPGIAIMLVIAGIIEGFFTPLAISAIGKLLFALGTGIGLIFYFCIPHLKSDD